MQAAPERRAYQTLDGLRGIGAFLVVTRHVPEFFWPFQAPESYLAVDLFYLVSGFVVAHAYGERLRAGGYFWTFVKTRVIRLYPLYIAGLAIGMAAAVLALTGHPVRGGPGWTWARLSEAIAVGVLMIPRFPGLTVNGSTLDGPTWTLWPELVANFVYAAAIKVINLWTLLAVIAVSAAGIIYAEFRFGTLDVGYNLTDQWAALARVAFSFFTGALLFRFVSEKETRSEAMAWVCMAVLAAMLAWRPSAAVKPWFELGVVLAGFPAMLLVAGKFEPGPLTGRVFSFIGLISYGIYIVHQPIGSLTRAIPRTVLRFPHEPWIYAYSLGFLGLLVVVAWQLDRRFDAPVRRVLRDWLLPNPKKTG
jgi:peptidoglycan/LPS O-acetylase OafA/YrhL